MIDLHAPGDQAHVVVAVGHRHGAVLGHPQAPAVRAVLLGQALEGEDAVGEAAGLEARPGIGVVQQQHGAAALVEDLPQGLHVVAVLRLVGGEHAHRRQGIDDHPLGALPGEDVLELAQGLVELHLRGGKQAVGPVLEDVLRPGDELDHADAVQGPAVGGGHLVQLGGGLGQGEVQPVLAAAGALEDELQPQGGLAGAAGALHQVDVIPAKAAAQDLVEAGHPRGGEGRMTAGGLLVVGRHVLLAPGWYGGTV